MELDEKMILENENSVSEVPDVFAGISPFVFVQGMNLFREDCLKNVSVDYFKQCVSNGRINNYDILILQLVYKYRLLNRRMLFTMTGKKEESLKKVLRKLVGNGFLCRYYCTYPAGSAASSSTPFFYGVSKGVFDYFSKTWDRGIFVVPEPLAAMKTLALNQYIVGAREYRDVMTSERFDIVIDINSYKYRYPYSNSFSVSDTPVTFVPIVIRREDKCIEQAITSLRIMFGMIRRFDLGAAPIIICEDLVHMSMIRNAIAADARLADIVIYYTYDLAIPGGRMFDRIYSCSGTTEDGKPAFSELSFDFDSKS